MKQYHCIPKSVKAAFWFLCCNVLQQAVSVISTPVFTRLLNTAEYGEYNAYNSICNMLMVIVTLNVFYGVYVQGLVKFEEDTKKYSASSQGLVLFLVLCWFGIYVFFNDAINEFLSLDTKQMICIFITIWTTAIYSFWAANQRNVLEYKKLVCVTALSSVLRPILGVILISFCSDKVMARIYGNVLVNLFIYLPLFFEHILKGKVLFVKKYWLYAIKLNFPLVPHYLANTVLSSFDIVMIKRMSGEEKAGIYGLAYSLSMVTLAFNQALSDIIGPWLYRKLKTKKEKEISGAVETALLIVGIVNLLLIVFSPEIVWLFAPKEYYEAIWVIPPVSMSVYFMFLYSIFVSFEYYYEKTYISSIASVMAAMLNVCLNYIFIPRYGFIAAAYTTLVCYVLYALFHYIAMEKICTKATGEGSPINKKHFSVISVLFLVVGFLFMFAYKNIIIRYSVVLVLLIVLICFRKRLMEKFKNILLLKRNLSD